MKDFCEHLKEEMNDALHVIAKEAESELEKANRSRQYMDATLDTLRKFILDYNFMSNEEEIEFFKEIKPGFYHELIYWNEIVYLETNRPAGRKKLIRFYNKVIDRINDFYDRNNDVMKIHKQKVNWHDQLIFLRKTDCKPLTAEEYFETDTQFSTLFSTILSKILAFERVTDFLEKRIKSMKRGEAIPMEQYNGKLNWTGSKAQLIELTYALASAGVINHGKLSVKQLFSNICPFLGTEVTHYFPYFQRMRIKKKDRGQFMTLLKDSLIRRMDESDENPRFA